MTEAEKAFFLKNGYLHARQVLAPELLDKVRPEFEQIWAAGGRANQLVLLKHRTFIDLIEHPPILARQAAIFGRQTQLLQYDFLRQEPGSTVPLRSWHRDLSFPGERPLATRPAPVRPGPHPAPVRPGPPPSPRYFPEAASRPPSRAKWDGWQNLRGQKGKRPS